MIIARERSGGCFLFRSPVVMLTPEDQTVYSHEGSFFEQCSRRNSGKKDSTTLIAIKHFLPGTLRDKAGGVAEKCYTKNYEEHNLTIVFLSFVQKEILYEFARSFQSIGFLEIHQ